MIRSHSNAASYVVFALSFICLYYLTPPLMYFPDTGWHLLVGEEIIKNGQPATNIWSHTALETPWLNISWVFDAILGYLNMHFGIESVVFFKNFICALTIMVIFENCLKRNVSVESALLATFAAALIFSFFAAARPHIITFLMVAVFHRILHMSREEKPLYPLFFLPPLMLLWVNMHGGFIAAIIMIGAYGIETIKLKDWKRFKILFITGILCVACVFLSPLGFEMLNAMTKAFGSAFTDQVKEWLPTDITGSAPTFIFCLVFLLTTNIQNVNIPIADKILVFFWFFMALIGYRHFVVFVVITAPYVAQSINAFDHEQKESLAKAIHDKKTKLITLLASIAVLLGFMALTPSFLNKKVIMDIDAIEMESNYKAITEFVLTNYPNATLYNTYTYGGEILYRTQGKLKVFVDGRAGTAYEESILESYMEISETGRNWQKELDKYNIDLLMLDKADRVAIAAENSPLWKTVYDEDDQMVFVRR